jgi:hypothetical protein
MYELCSFMAEAVDHGPTGSITAVPEMDEKRSRDLLVAPIVGYLVRATVETMTRLRPCPTCGKHIRLTEAACPFCDRRISIAAPSLGAVLLGLSLAACTSTTDKSRDDSSALDEPPENVPELAEPSIPAALPEPTPTEPETPSVETTPASAESMTSGNEQPDAGEEIEPEPAADRVEPVPRPKYGAPRPKQKYGGPAFPRKP